MCDFHHHDHSLPPLAADEYVLDTPFLRGFIADVRARIAAADSAGDACEAIEPLFTGLIADREWLPETYQRDAPQSGMGGGIGQWLLFRAADRSLSLFSLVVPAGAMTPVHDHLAWGLVGLVDPSPGMSEGLELVRLTQDVPLSTRQVADNPVLDRDATSTTADRPNDDPWEQVRDDRASLVERLVVKRPADLCSVHETDATGGVADERRERVRSLDRHEPLTHPVDVEGDRRHGVSEALRGQSPICQESFVLGAQAEQVAQLMPEVECLPEVM